MSQVIEANQNATAVITHRVRDTHHQEYEAWLEEIIPVAKAYPGHLGVLIIRPSEGGPSIYTIVIRFDSHEHLLNWMQSQDRNRLIKKAQPCLVEEDQYHVQSGLDFWFTPEGAKPKFPKKWKQSLVTWSAIYPLVVGTSLLVGALERLLDVPADVYSNTLLITGIVVLLMVYLVMPRYTKLVHRWLYN